MDSRSSGSRKPPNIMADARFRQAFVELLTGIDYAEMTNGDRWEYAVEIHVLRRFGLSNNDLRLLVQRQFVEHAREVTTFRSKARRFRPSSKLAFAKRTCFVLTPLGIAKACSQKHVDSDPAPVEVFPLDQPYRSQKLRGLPVWNGVRRELFYDGQIIRQFKRRAVNQELILAAFQEENWPRRIDDPLTPQLCQDSKSRLHDTIKCLNRGLDMELLHFCGDGTGKGVVWQPIV